MKLVNEPLSFEGYSGKDIKIFNDKEKWYKWQRDFYEKIFFETGVIKEPDSRKIVFIYDEKGNSGKSSFYKYLYYYHAEDMRRITYGTASQLRTSLINIGPKKIYLIDLTRSKGKQDEPSDLLSAIEDLKGGVVSSSMYGSGTTMLMDIPHIVISSNYLFEFNSLSSDRWEILSINDRKIINITNSVKRRQSREKIVKKQEMVLTN